MPGFDESPMMRPPVTAAAGCMMRCSASTRGAGGGGAGVCCARTITAASSARANAPAAGIAWRDNVMAPPMVLFSDELPHVHEEIRSVHISFQVDGHSLGERGNTRIRIRTRIRDEVPN